MVSDKTFLFLKDNWATVLMAILAVAILCNVTVKVYTGSANPMPMTLVGCDLANVEIGTKTVSEGKEFVVTEAVYYPWTYKPDEIMIELKEISH